MEGFYAIYYTGKSASGMGMLVFREGVIAGADASGGCYDGQYTLNQDKGTVDATIKMTIPPGGSLVTGFEAGQDGYQTEFPISFPFNFSSTEPIRVQMPTGPVNVNLKKIRDFPS